MSFGGGSMGPDTLISDAEREHVAVILRDAAGEGRLTQDELTTGSAWLSSASGDLRG